MIRDAVKEHTGREPPEMLPEPATFVPKSVELQPVPFIEILPFLHNLGDGIPAKYPEPMEHYGIGYADVLQCTCTFPLIHVFC